MHDMETRIDRGDMRLERAEAIKVWIFFDRKLHGKADGFCRQCARLLPIALERRPLKPSQTSFIKFVQNPYRRYIIFPTPFI